MIDSPFLRRRVVDAAFVALVAFVWFEGRAESRGGGDLDERFGAVRFRETARALGVDFEHRGAKLDPALSAVEPMIAGIGAAVSVCDVDGDGWPDLYATTSAHGEANALFVNRGDGTFEDRAEELGLAWLNEAGTGCSMGSVWADYDNDGRQDVFVYKWGHCALYRNLGEAGFEDVTETAGVGDWINSHGATWIDYDRDGRLDLYVTAYFHEDHDLWDVDTTRVLQDSYEFAQNGGRNRLYHNLGDGRFEEVGEAMGVASERWTLAAGVADFDGDGWVDLYLANDYGAEELFLNREGLRFEAARDVGLDHESKSGMCVALGSAANNGRLSVFVTNISARGFLFQGNNLRVNYVPDGAGLLQYAAGPVADCGWAWGAQFGDLNSDGFQDLFVVNGFVSKSTERDYWYQLTKVAGATGDLVADVANWPDMGDRSLSGYERSRVLLNVGRGIGRYAEVGREVGVLDTYDGRAVAMADLDRDGDLDVVVANQDGPLLVYANESESDHRWLAFELEGTESPRDPLGAEVRVTSSVGTQVQVVSSFSGLAAQNDARVHFGLGPDPGPVRVEVRWPSGRRTTLVDPELDRVHEMVEVTE